jgi:hypothetical protein
MNEENKKAYGKKSKTLNETIDLSTREQWGTQIEFLFACLGNAVGLGNASLSHFVFFKF